MRNILITGGSGRLAKELTNDLATYDTSFCRLTHEEMDICKLPLVEHYVNVHKPDIVIHAAAMTNPMQDHECYTDLSIQTNIVGTANVATACLRAEKVPKLIYISTDYVYQSSKFKCDELDDTIPCNNYGWSKLGGEIPVRMLPPDRWLILRASFTPLPWKHKQAYSDSYKSLITLEQASKLIARLIELDANGIYNVGGNKRQSLYTYAKDTLNIPDVEPISRLGAPYNVPEGTALNIYKFTDFLKNNSE